MLILRSYLRIIANQKSKALVLVILYGILLISIQGYPQNILLTSSLNYQEQDLIGIANLVSNHNTIDQKAISKYSTIGKIKIQTISEYQISSNGFTFSGISIVEFDDISEPLIKINEIWMNDLQSQRSLSIGELIFNQSQIESTEIINRLFNAIITLPIQYAANITTFCLGLDIRTDSDLVEDYDILYAKIEIFKQEIDELYHAEFQWEEFYSENAELLGVSIEKLELQIFTVSLLIFLTLLASIIYIQYSFEAANENIYYLLNLRGLSQEQISKYFIIYSTAFNTVLSSISIAIAYILTDINLDISLGLLYVIVLSTSIVVSYYSTKQNLIKSNDIFDIDYPPSILEIGLLILSILSFLVNVFVNSPSLDIVKYVLIIATYLSIGLLFSVILYYSLKYVSHIISRIYLNKQKTTPDQSLQWLFTKLNLRLNKKQIISTLVTGVLVISVLSHLSVVIDTNKMEDDNNTPYGDLWGQYPEKLPDNFNIDSFGQYSVGYPTSINFQISRLDGLVFTDTSLFSFHKQFAGENIKQTPELWVRQGNDLSNYISYLSFIQIGDNNEDSLSFTEILQIEKFYDPSIMLPGQPDFILFLDESLLSDYNSTSMLLFDIYPDIRMPEFQNYILDQLEKDLLWIQPPVANIIDHSVRHIMDENTWLDVKFTYIFSLFIIFSLSVVESRMRFGKEFEIMRLRGVTRNQFRKVGLILYLREIPMRLIFYTLGVSSILFLINIFHLISINVSIDLINIVKNVILFSIVIYLGQLSNWFLQIKSAK